MKKQKQSKTNKKVSSISTSKKSEEVEKVSYPHDQMMQALYWIFDGFDRSSMGMFLVYDTAIQAMDNKIMSGDKISVGTRLLEWESGSTTILRNFVGDPIEVTQKYEVFKNPFNKVPVYVYLFDRHPCIENTKQIVYENEAFMVPNTYKQFIEVFGDKP